MDTKTKRYIIVAASVVVTLSAFLVAVLYSASKNGVNVPVKAAENLKEPDKTDIAENAAVMPDVTGMNYEEAQELLIAQSNIGSIYDFAGGKLLRQEKEEQKR